MDNKELAIITIAIIVGCCVIRGFVYTELATNDSVESDIIANITNNDVV